MTRRRLPGFAALAWFGLLGGLWTASCTPSSPSGPDAAPSATAEGADVLLITIDTLRADAVGFAGDVSGKAKASTPTLDRLATAGRVYTDAHAHNVVTLPSHANILTGMYPWQHGVRDNSGFVLPESAPTLAARLKEAGYATAAFVGAYPLEASFGLNRGFDVYDDKFPRGARPDDFAIAERRGDQVVGPALAWWNAQRGKRRFLWVHLYDPHAAYDPPEPFRSRFRDNLYQGEVAATDSFLAPLLGPLLDGGQPPALVVVTADHGESLGEHGELTHGLFAYEATLKVPLVVWGPGVQTGRDDRPARHVDIVPTVLGALGLELPKDLPGRSLLAAADPQAVTYFESLTTHLNRGWAPLRGVIRDRNKLIDLPLPELYNLARDPREETNLYAEERRTARALQGEIAEESVWPPPKGQVTPEQEAKLRSLGYSVGSAGEKKTFTTADDPKNLVELDHKLHQIVDLYSRGQYEQAVTLGREMIAARPDLVEASEHLALSLRQLERHDEAITVLQAAFSRGSSQGAVRESLRRQLGMALAEAGRPSEAVEMLRPLAEAGDAQTLNALGVALSDAGQPAEALRVLQQAAAKYPNDPKAHENLGIVMLRMERVPEARDHLRRALELNPDLPIAWNTLGVALYRLEGPAAAIAAWERAVALDPTQFDALYNTGLVAAQAGRPAEAREALRRFVATAPPQRFASEIARARQVLSQLGS